MGNVAATTEKKLESYFIHRKDNSLKQTYSSNNNMPDKNYLVLIMENR